jgi:hypothetical protein
VLKIIDTGTGQRVGSTSSGPTTFEEQYGNLTDSGDAVLLLLRGHDSSRSGRSQARRRLCGSLRAHCAPNVAAGGSEARSSSRPTYHEAIVLRAVIRLYLLADDTDMAAAFKPFYDEAVASDGRGGLPTPVRRARVHPRRRLSTTGTTTSNERG